MNERLNLLDIKNALNKIEDDEKLSKFTITHRMFGTDDPTAEVSLMFFADEEEHTDLFNMFDLEEIQIINKFAKQIWEDSKMAIAGSLDDDVFEMYTERYT